ncbi:MAG: homoserine dehydrogenase [Phycisphaerae bacterium]
MSQNEQSPFGVTVVGCGTVGAATCQLLLNDAELLARRLGRPLELKYIVDVDFTNARNASLPETLYCERLETALADESVHLVIELVGGTGIARQIVADAVAAGKHVVTANKALLAHHGVELYATARANDVSIAFEASCGGGIPIIRALTDGLVANRFDALYGIVNGTCNYILTEMIAEGVAYEQALREAQQEGLAEADPTFDVEGVDSAHKLAIMAALAFGVKVDFDQIPVEGIDKLQLCDLSYGHELGYVVKLLAIATRQAGGISLRVRPAFISLHHPLAWVSGPFNAISVYGHATGHTMYYGRGAGGQPTASAVVADVASVALGAYPAMFRTMGLWPDRNEPGNQLDADEIRSRFYLRLMVKDVPGVLGRIAVILGEKGIGISSVLQHEPPFEGSQDVPVIITTYRSRQGDLREAMEQVNSMDVVKDECVCIPIVDEHPEQLL